MTSHVYHGTLRQMQAQAASLPPSKIASEDLRQAVSEVGGRATAVYVSADMLATLMDAGPCTAFAVADMVRVVPLPPTCDARIEGPLGVVEVWR